MTRRSHAERTEQTRAALIASGRRLFAEQGFASTSAQALVEEAGLTRGALYHHFDGKSGLFEAVVVDAHTEVARAIERAAHDAATPWAAIEAGCRAFVLETNRRALRRIVLEDAVSVLGIKRWRAIDSEHGVALLRQGLRACGIAEEAREALARLLSGATNEAAFWLAEAPTSRARRTEVLAGLGAMVAAIAVGAGIPQASS